MFLMCPNALIDPLPTDRQTGEAGSDGAWHEDPALLLRRRLEELERLRQAGMGIAETMHGWLDGSVSDDELSMTIGGRAVVSEFCRVARAVRQVIVLELELTGQRPAPDRDAVREPREADKTEEGPERGDGDGRERDNLNDYDNGPLDQVVAKVRNAVGQEAPEDDPFAPPETRRARAVAGRSSDQQAPVERSPVDDRLGGQDGPRPSCAPLPAGAPAPSPSRRKATGPALSRGAGEGNSVPNAVRKALLAGAASSAFYRDGRNRGPPG